MKKRFEDSQKTVEQLKDDLIKDLDDSFSNILRRAVYSAPSRVRPRGRQTCCTNLNKEGRSANSGGDAHFPPIVDAQTSFRSTKLKKFNPEAAFPDIEPATKIVPTKPQRFQSFEALPYAGSPIPPTRNQKDSLKSAGPINLNFETKSSFFPEITPNRVNQKPAVKSETTIIRLPSLPKLDPIKHVSWNTGPVTSKGANNFHLFTEDNENVSPNGHTFPLKGVDSLSAHDDVKKADKDESDIFMMDTGHQRTPSPDDHGPFHYQEYPRERSSMLPSIGSSNRQFSFDGQSAHGYIRKPSVASATVTFVDGVVSESTPEFEEVFVPRLSNAKRLLSLVEELSDNERSNIAQENHSPHLTELVQTEKPNSPVSDSSKLLSDMQTEVRHSPEKTQHYSSSSDVNPVEGLLKQPEPEVDLKESADVLKMPTENMSSVSQRIVDESTMDVPTGKSPSTPEPLTAKPPLASNSLSGGLFSNIDLETPHSISQTSHVGLPNTSVAPPTEMLPAASAASHASLHSSPAPPRLGKSSAPRTALKLSPPTHSTPKLTISAETHSVLDGSPTDVQPPSNTSMVSQSVLDSTFQRVCICILYFLANTYWTLDLVIVVILVHKLAIISCSMIHFRSTEMNVHLVIVCIFRC